MKSRGKGRAGHPAQRPHRQCGCSSIEALVALGLLGIVTSAVLATLAGAAGMRATSSHGLAATALTTSIVEYLRAGHEPPADLDERYRYSWSAEEHPEFAGLSRYEVLVEWRDRVPRSLEVRGLMRRPQ